MIIVITLIIVACAIELLIFVPVLWPVHILLAMLSSFLMATTCVFVFESWPSILAASFVILMAFRVFNLARLVEGRMHQIYRRKVTAKSSYYLVSVTIILTLISFVDFNYYHMPFFKSLIFLQLFSSLVVFLVLVFNLRKYRRPVIEQFLIDKDLPTVTVAIPARNETNDMADCLRSLLASDYPKLEILVLDDCSQDKTAQTIKSFAQQGVRFILGEPANELWLAKNFAYQQLLQEASGDFVLFCGVDTRFSPSTIRNLVQTMLQQKLHMLSVLPLRQISMPSLALIQPLRYWWELVLPRTIFSRPAVLSTVWLINRDTINKMGQFKAIQRSVLPEAYFASKLQKAGKYAFYRHDGDIDVQTRKSYQDQRLTALRMRYPQVHKRPELVLALLCVELLLLVAPMVQTIIFAVQQSWLLFGPSLASYLILVLVHCMVVYVTNPGNSLVALVNFPVVVLSELVIALSSMFKYEFSQISWKDRNVCIPVMHVYPHLPRLPNRQIVGQTNRE